MGEARTGGMTARHRLERVVDLLCVSGADRTVVHDRLEASSDRAGVDDGLADGEEVRSESSLRSSSVSCEKSREKVAHDEPFDDCDDLVST